VNVSYATRSDSTVSAADTWTQARHFIAIETPLGRDRLLLTSIMGHEGISELFQYDLQMLSLDHKISPESLIGRCVKIGVASEDGKTRAFHGMVAQLRVGPLVERDLRQYNAQVVPWLWYTQTTSEPENLRGR
jgi:type VI secretion system secreted protein VgrG